LPKPAFSVYRNKFDKALLERALSPHVSFLRSKGELVSISDKARVRVGDEIIEGELLIAADGSSSPILRQLGLRRSDAHVVCAQYDIILDKDRVDDSIGDNFEVFLGEEVSPYGYGWIVPKTGGNVYLGVGCHASRLQGDVKRRLDYLLKEHPISSEKVRGGKVKRLTRG